jgi:hypothetical protein
MPLNENLTFSTAPAEVKASFLGVPDKVWLAPGRKLFKWTDYPLVNNGRITPWWCFVERTGLPSGSVAEGFRDSEMRAHRLGVSHRKYQGVRAAISEKFNNKLENLLLAEITTGVWGFAGVTRGQAEFKDPKLANVYLIGGRGQLWIPNLTDADIREIPSLG